MVSKLALDVKALALLYGSDTKLYSLLQKEFIESRDEDIMRFVEALQGNHKSHPDGGLIVALGEIILASFLAILGIVAFIPNLIGLDTPQALFDYFSGLVPPSLDSGPLFSTVAAVEFVFAALLMLGAFYTLRQASVNLKHSGIVADSSER